MVLRVNHMRLRLSMKIIPVSILFFCICVLSLTGAGCQVKTGGSVETSVGTHHRI